MASSALSCCPIPVSARTPTIRQMPIIPQMTPKSCRPVADCPRARHQARTKVKIGADEFSMVARPASTDCSAQAIKVKGITLLEQEAAPDREIGRHRDAAPTQYSQQHNGRDRRACRDQRYRGNRLDAQLDE